MLIKSAMSTISTFSGMLLMKNGKIRKAARSEDCTLCIPGVCNYNNETTVFAHFPDESHGIGRKSDDISGGFACSSCHDAIDRRIKVEISGEDREFYMRRSQTRTLRRLIELGIVTVK